MKIAHIVIGLVVGSAAFAFNDSAHAQDAAWKPAGDHIKTRWAKDVNPAAPLPEYPRPMLVRDKWLNLNGLWDYRVVSGGNDPQVEASGKILVPFPIESSLSGVARRVQSTEMLHCSRTFTIPDGWGGQRVMLHFGAVNWQSWVLVNGQQVKEHSGGYDPFAVDITNALKPGGLNELLVIANNPGNSGGQPRGKQYDKSHAIWYESSSGIWQTVWMEPVAASRIEKIVAKTNVGTGEVDFAVTVGGAGGAGEACKIEVLDGDKVVGICQGVAATGLKCTITNAKLWSPDAPNLYTVRAIMGTDKVSSYFGFREIKVAKDEKGINRLMLNGKPLFQYGPLDQGFWPDGLYTAPTDEALKFDIEAVKKMGGNMLRKHVKVEPERFYTWCDKIGILVWQDMPSSFFKSKDFDEGFPQFDEKWAENFEREWKNIMTARGGHPSIIMWVPFNEGWGQNDQNWAKSVVLKTKEWDPTRLVNNASGWHDMGVGDVHDIHEYPDPKTPALEDKRAAVLGEFGGLGLPLEGHTWVNNKDNWGYRSYKNKEEVTAAYCSMMDQLPALIAQGLNAAVYTQTTDVEIECNGWLTYDREVWKVDPVRAKEATQQVYQSAPVIKTILSHAGDAGSTKRTWKYTTTEPAADWMKPDATATSWKEGPAGFGTSVTPGAVIGTEWTTGDIWIRTEFTLDSVPTRPYLSIHHDEDAEVYINGVQAMTLKGYSSAYLLLRLSKEAAALLKAGNNTIAIHCKQTRGGQYIDCGIADVAPGK